MPIRFFQRVSPLWYNHLNDATLVASGMIVVGFLSLNVYLEEVGETIAININPVVAGIATANIIYSAILYRFVAKKSKLYAGFISFFLFSATTLYLIIDTGGFESQFLGLWIVVALLAGLFGWKTLSMLWLATNVYYLLIVTEVIEVETDLQRMVLYLIGTQLPFLMSFFIWNGQSTDEGSSKKSSSRSSFAKNDLGSDVLINSIAEGVVVVDAKLTIQVFNYSAAEITGWKEEEAMGLDYRSVFTLTDVHDAQILQENDPIMRVLSDGKTVVDNTIILHTRNNKRMEISLVASAVKADDGVIGGAIGVFRDISAERDQERQRAEFISTASHEMRTPVAAIEGYLALAMNDQVSKIDSKAREYLGKAHSSTQHLGKLFQDLLTAAKSEDGRLNISKRVTDIGAMIEEVAEGTKFAADKKGLILETNYTSGNATQGETVLRPIIYVHVDPDRIREVLTNIIDNAIKYTDEGKIGITMKTDKENIVIGINDTGAGIPQEDIPHLFQKFYRVDNTATRQVGGTGLGLFISRKIVELNNGRIWVESVVGRGSSFNISLPIVDNAKAQALLKEEQSKKTPLSDVTASANL